MSTIKSYIAKHRERFLQELTAFLSIPSISVLPAHRAEVAQAARWTCEALKSAGADEARLINTSGHPLVYGHKRVDPTLPTVLVYGHYDVQPADPYELWDTPPFEPQIREGQVYARGASDDKGQVHAHIKALEAMQATGSLPCNIKFLIEGEEETASKALSEFLRKPEHLELLQADTVLVSDTTLISMEQPSTPISLRGMATLEVTVEGAQRDLHSGLYGGAVANPIQVLCQMIAALKDDQGRVTVPGFYDQVVAHSPERRAAINDRPFDAAAYKKELGVDALVGEAGYTTLERIGIRPTLEVNGLWGGYTGEGVKTVLPSQAHAKISLRLVPHQPARQIEAALASYLLTLAPAGVRVKVRSHEVASDALEVAPGSKALQAIAQAFQQVWGKEPVQTSEGGSVPILTQLQQALGTDMALMGFGLESDQIHAPNERFGLENYFSAIETIAAFYQHYAQLHV